MVLCKAAHTSTSGGMCEQMYVSIPQAFVSSQPAHTVSTTRDLRIGVPNTKFLSSIQSAYSQRTVSITVSVKFLR